MSTPRISVITVVYNGSDTINKTIKSIAEQSYKNIEYIVVDGNSKDNTLEIIKNNSQTITQWISEPDKGLYDAMNKGLKMATGDYVCFINSGDVLYSNDTLNTIFEKFTDKLPDIVYGETMIVDNYGAEIGLRRLKAPETLTWKSFRDGMVVCHQSILVKRQIADLYNLKYKISADYEWVLKALKKANSIYNSHQIIAKFLDGGLNKKNIRRGLIERFKVMIAHYGFFSTLFNHFVIGAKFFRFWIKNKRF